MTSRNGYFPGKTKAKRSAIITPRTAQETLNCNIQIYTSSCFY